MRLRPFIPKGSSIRLESALQIVTVNPIFSDVGLPNHCDRMGDRAHEQAILDELSSLALIMLSVLIADGMLIHQTWVAIAPIGEEGLTNFGRKSLLQVLYRNGKLHLSLVQDHLLTCNQKPDTSRGSSVTRHSYPYLLMPPYIRITIGIRVCSFGLTMALVTYTLLPEKRDSMN